MKVFGFMLLLALGSSSNVVPPSPYIDVGVCPFECCIYRDWRAERELTLFDNPDGKKIAKLAKGEWVKALGGETHSIPLKVVATREIPEAGLHPGDTFYVLHYEGEGYWKIWYKGKTFDAESGDSRFPKTTWWARVQRKNGSIGWAVAGGEAFSNQDQCG
jgi:hypothetical protein